MVMMRSSRNFILKFQISLLQVVERRLAHDALLHQLGPTRVESALKAARIYGVKSVLPALKTHQLLGSKLCNAGQRELKTAVSALISIKSGDDGVAACGPARSLASQNLTGAARKWMTSRPPCAREEHQPRARSRAASWLIQAVKNSFGACWLKRSLHPEKRNGSAGRRRRDEFEDRADFSRHRSSYDLDVVVRGRDSLLSFRLWLMVNFFKIQASTTSPLTTRNSPSERTWPILGWTTSGHRT